MRQAILLGNRTCLRLCFNAHFTLFYRQCLTNAVNYKAGRRYCADGCASQTFCGDVLVPEQHLHVSCLAASE